MQKMAMKIQFTSDLHLEFEGQLEGFMKNPLKPLSEVLLIAGDFSELKSQCEFKNQDGLKPVLDYLSQNWKLVFFIPGNHEYYDNDISHFSDSWLTAVSGYKNLFMGNNYTQQIGGYVFIFTTLWAYIPRQDAIFFNKFMDFSNILNGSQPLDIAKYNQLYSASIGFIESTCEKFPDKPKVLVSHHLPSLDFISSYHKEYSLKNGAYASNAFSRFINENIKYWIFGHSHHKIDRKKYGCRFLSNPFGFVGSERCFKPKKVIKV